MKGRNIIGIILGCLGLILLIIGGYYLYHTLFVLSLQSMVYMSVYLIYVILPLLIGALMILDGISISSYKRKISIPFYILGNVGWIYFIYLINGILTQEAFQIEDYYMPTLIFFGSLIVFAIGALVNSIE